MHTATVCFSTDQHPPLPPRSSDVGDHGPTVLTADDGTRLAAYDAVPVTRRGASLVLLPDIRGMHPYYTDLAIAFAQAGIDTVAIDPYARTAGLSARGEGFEFRSHADALKRSSVTADAAAAMDRLASRSDDPVFEFFFGGRARPQQQPQVGIRIWEMRFSNGRPAIGQLEPMTEKRRQVVRFRRDVLQDPVGQHPQSQVGLAEALVLEVDQLVRPHPDQQIDLPIGQ